MFFSSWRFACAGLIANPLFLGHFLDYDYSSGSLLGDGQRWGKIPAA
jgi:hypothetical protein